MRPCGKIRHTTQRGSRDRAQAHARGMPAAKQEGASWQPLVRCVPLLASDFQVPQPAGAVPEDSLDAAAERDRCDGEPLRLLAPQPPRLA
jgi:hypothetical protein